MHQVPTMKNNIYSDKINILFWNFARYFQSNSSYLGEFSLKNMKKLRRKIKRGWGYTPCIIHCILVTAEWQVKYSLAYKDDIWSKHIVLILDGRELSDVHVWGKSGLFYITYYIFLYEISIKILRWRIWPLYYFWQDFLQFGHLFLPELSDNW